MGLWSVDAPRCQRERQPLLQGGRRELRADAGGHREVSPPDRRSVPDTGRKWLAISQNFSAGAGGVSAHIHVDILDLCVEVERMHPQLTANAGLLEAAEGRLGVDTAVAI